uniref:Uncharacterized protein n=1 Tax=Arundo donax TaxID=35708 RepID=A0A0A9BPT6_ARUDO
MKRQYQVAVEGDVVAGAGAGEAGEEGSAMEEQIMMMRMDTQRRPHGDTVAEGEDEEGVDPLGLEGVMVVTVMQWKALVDTMMRSIMHHQCKDMKVAGAGVVAEGVAVDVEGVAVDLLHKSRLGWLINNGMLQLSSSLD